MKYLYVFLLSSCLLFLSSCSTIKYVTLLNDKQPPFLAYRGDRIERQDQKLIPSSLVLDFNAYVVPEGEFQRLLDIEKKAASAGIR